MRTEWSIVCWCGGGVGGGGGVGCGGGVVGGGVGG